MQWHDRLKSRFEATGWKKAELAKRSGVPYDSLLKYLGGDVKQPRGDTLDKIAEALGTTSLWLEYGIEDQPANEPLTAIREFDGKITGVSVSGFVKAGVWQDARSGGPRAMSVPSIGGYPADCQVAFIVDGESLNKIARDGDVLICLDLIKTGVSIRDNDLVIVEMTKHDGEFVDRSAKRVRKTLSGYELWPESDHPDFQEPMVLDRVDEGVEMTVSAKVLWIIRKP